MRENEFTLIDLLRVGDGAKLEDVAELAPVNGEVPGGRAGGKDEAGVLLLLSVGGDNLRGEVDRRDRSRSAQVDVELGLVLGGWTKSNLGGVGDESLGLDNARKEGN